MSSLLLSPHQDDECLFAAFTILRDQPLIAIVFDSYVQVNAGHPECNADARRAETMAAMRVLFQSNTPPVQFLGFRDDDSPDRDAISGALDQLGEFERVYAPAIEAGGHAQHNLVGAIAKDIFGHRVTHYLTYTNRGKSTSERGVAFEPEWPLLKLRALSCYESQIRLQSTRDHFLRDQYEYYQ